MKRDNSNLNHEQKRAFLQMTGLMGLYYFGNFLFIPLLAPYVATLGLDKFQISLIFSIYPMMLFFTSPIVGALSDETGRRRVILLGLVFEIIAILFYVFDKTWWVFLIARAIDAISFSAVVLVGLSAVEDGLTKHNRGRYTGLSLSLLHVGKLIGPIAGGLLADIFFLKMPFIIGGFVVFLLLVAFYAKTRSAGSAAPLRKPSLGALNVIGQLRWFLSIRKLRGMAILGIMMHATFPLTTIFIPLFIKEHFGLPYIFIGIAIFCTEMPLLFQFVYGRLADRFPHHYTVLFGTIFYGAALILLSITATYWTFTFALILAGIGVGCWNIGAWTLMADIGEQHKKISSVVCSYVSIARIGEVISTVASGYIALTQGTAVLIVLNGIFVLIVSVWAHHWLKE
ncbi:MFS transporter [Candidatus Woesearchaeota archaeon]|nr:MFS transporter [Candidatus Woesearchaeota archaeon]